MPAHTVSRLDEIIASFALEPAAAQGLRRYVELLATYDRANIVGLRDRDAIAERLVGDSLALLTLAEVRARADALDSESGSPALGSPAAGGPAPRSPAWADLGSGGGVPGIPLALALPRVTMVLVEAVGKKCAFLEQAVLAMELQERVRVAWARSERLAALGSADREAYAVVVAKAVGPLATVAELAAPLLQVGGVLLAPKTGEAVRREAAQGEAAGAACGLALRRLAPLQRSPLRDSVCAIFEKVAPAPEWLPRREGLAQRRPLS